MKKITVVGGGLAGWLSALYVQKCGFTEEITLIESSEIGILGAGEGSVPALREMLVGLLGVNEKAFIKRTNSTKKVAINFENWSGTGSKYDHDFIGMFKDYFQNLSESKFDHTDIYAYHFDARLIADFLKELALERGIKLIDGEVIDFQLSVNNDIKGLILKDNTIIKTDFVFDCSGFKRLIIGKLHETEWISYEDQLKVNTAVPFFLPRTDTEEFTKTDAITMKCGWMWKIPLKDRWGCGYVFDKKYTTEEEAKKEVIEFLGHDVSFNRTLNFNSGCYKDTWVGNCIAIGLSSGFMEPLEATSILVAIQQLHAIYRHVSHIGFENYHQAIGSYNEFVRNINEQMMLFVRYHYICDRQDTPFWIDYKNLDIPKKLQKYIDSDLSDLDILLHHTQKFPMFSNWSYQLVKKGNFDL